MSQTGKLTLQLRQLLLRVHGAVQSLSWGHLEADVVCGIFPMTQLFPGKDSPSHTCVMGDLDKRIYNGLFPVTKTWLLPRCPSL